MHAQRSSQRSPVEVLPRPLRVAAAFGWRLLVVIAVLWVLTQVVQRLSTITVSVLLALLLTALLAPLVSWLERHHVPRSLGTALAILGGLGLIGTLVTFVVNSVANGWSDLVTKAGQSLSTIRGLLANSPFSIESVRLSQLVDAASNAIQRNQELLTSRALNTAATLGEIGTGVGITLFTLIFFVYEGRSIWLFLLIGVPKEHRGAVDLAASRAYLSVVGYVRATAVVAAVDALGIGVGLWILGVPLVLPLTALVLIGAFIPIVGSLLSGSLAVLVALVANGPIPALIVLGIVLAVMQLEGNVLQPLLLGRAVKVHPLAVVLGITAGLTLAGIAGGLLAVPIIAATKAAVRSLRNHDPRLVHAGDGREPDVADPEETDSTVPGVDSPEAQGKPAPPEAQGKPAPPEAGGKADHDEGIGTADVQEAESSTSASPLHRD